MVTLETYLGTLVSNLSQAKVLADLESAKIAGEYAANNLLQHFSIPRMKIEEVEMTIPVAVAAVTPPPKPPVPFDPAKFETMTYALILRALALEALPGDTASVFQSEIAKQTGTLAARMTKENAADLLYDYALHLAHVTYSQLDVLAEHKILTKKTAKEKKLITDRLTESLREELKGELHFNTLPSLSGQVLVTVETDKLKEKNPNTLLLIKMKISEEGMIWERIDDGDGTIVKKLMPA